MTANKTPEDVMAGVKAVSIGKGPRSRKPRRRRRMLTGVSRQRRAANARERRRIQGVNNAFVELKNHIPVQQPEDVSKIDTLRLAAKWIAHLTALLIQDDKKRCSGCEDHQGLPKDIQDRLFELIDFEIEDFVLVSNGLVVGKDFVESERSCLSNDGSNVSLSSGSCGFSDGEDTNTNSPGFESYENIDIALDECSEETLQDATERLFCQPNPGLSSSCLFSGQQNSVNKTTHCDNNKYRENFSFSQTSGDQYAPVSPSLSRQNHCHHNAFTFQGCGLESFQSGELQVDSFPSYMLPPIYR